MNFSAYFPRKFSRIMKALFGYIFMLYSNQVGLPQNRENKPYI